MPGSFTNAIITTAGAALLARVEAGQATMEVTQVAVGDGLYSAAERTAASLSARTSLKAQKNIYTPSSATVMSEDSIKIKTIFSNYDAVEQVPLVTSGYFINEIAVYCKENGGAANTEVLYCIAVTSGETGNYMPAYVGGGASQIVQDIFLTVGIAATTYVNKAGAAFLATEGQALKSEVASIKTRAESNTSAITALDTRVNGLIGSATPTPVATAAQTTDTSIIYVYTGSETGYTPGDWYYYDSSSFSWKSGGEYGAALIDDTLTKKGQAADAKATGKIREDFENAFTVIRPHDYGDDILLDDLYISNSQFIEVTRIKDGNFNVDKMQNKSCYIQFKFNEIPKARAAAPVTYDFSIHIPDSDTIVDVLRFKDANTVVASTLNGEEQGAMIKSEDTYKLTYEYRNQSVMYWQLTFLPAPAYNKPITVSAIINGEKTEYNISPSQIEPYLKERDGIAFEPPRNALKEIKYYGVNWTQGACTVLDSYIGFSAAPNDHSTNGVAKIARFDDFENYTSISHNLGHCSSADYNEMTDTMIVGSGTYVDGVAGVAPAIFLVENASNIVTNKTDIVYGSSGVIEIPLNGIDGEGSVACFGECEKIAYIVTSEDASDFRNKGGKYIYRALLGMGADDMTSVFESDSYGTFIGGCADNEYNGTLHILSKFECEFFGELQGLKYINGRLVFPTDVVTDSVLTSYLLLVRFNSDSDVFFDKIYWIPMLNNDGTLISTECEDVIFHNGRGYVVAVSKKTGQSNIYRTHVFDAFGL